MKTAAIIQARMGSTRFPGKTLANLCGLPMLAVLLHRLHKITEIDEIIVATTTCTSDDILVKWLQDNEYTFYRGSENDVLDRFWQCAKKHNIDVIVRVTADDPLKDPEIVKSAIRIFNEKAGVDYVSNTVKPTYPEGLDIEVFSLKSLEDAHLNARLISEREHVTPYIWKNPEKFVIESFQMEEDLSHWRWTVDKPADLVFINKVLFNLNNNIDVGYREIIDLLRGRADLLEINSGAVRNEGYLNSLMMEQ